MTWLGSSNEKTKEECAPVMFAGLRSQRGCRVNVMFFRAGLRRNDDVRLASEWTGAPGAGRAGTLDTISLVQGVSIDMTVDSGAPKAVRMAGQASSTAECGVPVGKESIKLLALFHWTPRTPRSLVPDWARLKRSGCESPQSVAGGLPPKRTTSLTGLDTERPVAWLGRRVEVGLRGRPDGAGTTVRGCWARVLLRVRRFLGAGFVGVEVGSGVTASDSGEGGREPTRASA